jgi:hypothetical protein
MIKSADRASVVRPGSDGLMWFSPALDRAFANKSCFEALLLQAEKIAFMNPLNAFSNRIEFDGIGV